MFSDLETVLQVKPILKGVKFHMTKLGPDSNVVLEILIVNPRTLRIIPFARVEKQLMSTELSGLKILDVNHNRIDNTGNLKNHF
jgi:hypothetical protein